MTRLPISPPATVVTQSQEEEKFFIFSFGSFSQLDILDPVWIDVAYFHLAQSSGHLGFKRVNSLNPLKQALYGGIFFCIYFLLIATNKFRDGRGCHQTLLKA